MNQQFDDFIIDRLFQPVIDRLEIEPYPASRFLITGVILTCFVLAGLHWREPVSSALCLFPAGAFGLAYRNRGVMGRIGLAPLRTLLLLAYALAMVFDLQMLPRQPENAILQLIQHILIVLIFYVSACSKPPPRRKPAPVWVTAAP